MTDAHAVERFLRGLPNLPSPEAHLEEDDDICFEWNINPSATLSVSVSRDGRISWAGLFETWKECGHFHVEDLWPAKFTEALLRLDAATEWEK